MTETPWHQDEVWLEGEYVVVPNVRTQLHKANDQEEVDTVLDDVMMNNLDCQDGSVVGEDLAMLNEKMEPNKASSMVVVPAWLGISWICLC